MTSSKYLFKIGDPVIRCNRDFGVHSLQRVPVGTKGILVNKQNKVNQGWIVKWNNGVCAFSIENNFRLDTEIIIRDCIKQILKED